MYDEMGDKYLDCINNVCHGKKELWQESALFCVFLDECFQSEKLSPCHLNPPAAENSNHQRLSNYLSFPAAKELIFSFKTTTHRLLVSLCNYLLSYKCAYKNTLYIYNSHAICITIYNTKYNTIISLICSLSFVPLKWATVTHE